jgi:hypothetical protein
MSVGSAEHTTQDYSYEQQLSRQICQDFKLYYKNKSIQNRNIN